MNEPITTREWDAEAYRCVASPQLAWGLAVLDRVALRGDEVVADVGCGDGRLTTELARRVARGRVVAVDRSTNMTRLARELSTPRPAYGIHVVQADAAALPFAGAFELVFSAATFHWVLDHDALFRSVYTALRRGGLLVAQCGGEGNLARILQRADILALDDPYSPFFAAWHYPVEFAGAERTAERLHAAGFVDVETSREPAPTVFPTEQACAAFLATVVLRSYLQRLPDAQLRATFVGTIAKRCGLDSPPYELDYQRLNLRARKPL